MWGGQDIDIFPCHSMIQIIQHLYAIVGKQLQAPDCLAWTCMQSFCEGSALSGPYQSLFLFKKILHGGHA